MLEWYLVYREAAIFEPMIKQNLSFRFSIYNKLKHCSIVIEWLVSFKQHVEHVTATVIDHLSNYMHDVWYIVRNKFAWEKDGYTKEIS